MLRECTIYIHRVQRHDLEFRMRSLVKPLLPLACSTTPASDPPDTAGFSHDVPDLASA